MKNQYYLSDVFSKPLTGGFGFLDMVRKPEEQEAESETSRKNLLDHYRQQAEPKFSKKTPRKLRSLLRNPSLGESRLTKSFSGYLTKAAGEACKVGETAAKTDCIPATKVPLEPKPSQAESENEPKPSPGTAAAAGSVPGPDPKSGGTDSSKPGGNAGTSAGGIITARAELTKPADPNLVPEELRKHLMDHQVQGVAKAVDSMNKWGGALNADGTGVGKSREELAVAKIYADQGKKVLLISPAGVIKPDWKKEEFGGSFKDDGKAMGVKLKLNDGTEELKPGEINLTTYEKLNKLKDKIDANTILIWDEAHRAKRYGSAQAQHAYDMNKKAGAVMYCTATPADKPMEMTYLFRARVFGDRSWKETYEELGMEQVDQHTPNGVKKIWKKSPSVSAAESLRRMEGLFDRMTEDGLMIKREVSMAQVDVQTEHVELPPEGKAKMEQIDKEMSGDDVYNKIQQHKENIWNLKGNLWQLGQLAKDESGGMGGNMGIGAVSESTKKAIAKVQAKIALEQAHLQAAYAEAKTKNRGVVLMTQRLAQERYKIHSAVESIMNELAEGRQVVLFGASVNKTGDEEEGEPSDVMDEGTMKLLREVLKMEGIEFGELHGNISKAKQRKYMEDFQAGKLPVVIGTTNSAGTGVNLDDRKGDKPRTLIMMTPPFSAVDNIQAAGRINRLTTKSGSRIRYLLSDSSVDKWNASLISGKMKTLGAIVSGSVGELDIDSEGVSDTQAELGKLIEEKGSYKWQSLVASKPAADVIMPFGQHKGVKMKDVPVDYLQYALANFTNMKPDLKTAIKEHLKATEQPEVAPAPVMPANAADVVMPFGKHKGKKLKDVPESYLKWMLENVNLKPLLKSAVQTHLGVL